MRLALVLLAMALMVAAFIMGLQGRLQALFHPAVAIAALVLAPLAAVLGRRAGEQVARQRRASRHRRPPLPLLATLLVVLPAGVLFGVAGRASSGAFRAPSPLELLVQAVVWVGLTALLASQKGRFRLWRFGED
jgi:hypothetical protein